MPRTALSISCPDPYVPASPRAIARHLRTEHTELYAHPTDAIELIEKMGYRSKSNYQEGKEAYLKNDFKRALEILKPLAEDGDSWSQYILSLMYESGQGVEKNQEESIRWLILAAESGVPKIQYDLGIRYFYGYGIEKNYSEAAKWWESSANAGIADSQYNLGLLYYRGIGIPKDKKKASRDQKKNGRR